MALLSCIVVAALPVKINQASMTSITGLQISVPSQFYLKQNQDFDFRLHLFNVTNGYPIKSATCFFHLYNNSGNHIYTGNTSTTEHDFDFAFMLKGGNFSNVGVYNYIVQCNSSGMGGFVSSNFAVTLTGVGQEVSASALPTILAVMFIISVYLILIRFFALELFMEHGVVKLLLLMMGLWFMMFPIAIVREVNVFVVDSINVVGFLDTMYILMMWINIFITTYFILWFITQIFKKLMIHKEKLRLSHP